ncbi:MAG TPA: DNA mismatch repair protein [Parasegetibacter sp.]|jgi:DNA mismatch repair protein MutS
MSFYADKQTLEDLNLLGKYRPNSIFSIFNNVKTRGGEKLMDEMFHHPLTDAEQINFRTKLFQFFGEKELVFPFSEEEFETMESYLLSGGGQNQIVSAIHTVRRKALKSMGLVQEYNLINNGFRVTVNLLQQLYKFFKQLEQDGERNPLYNQIKRFNELYHNKKLSWIAEWNSSVPVSLAKMATYDHRLRNVFREEMKQMLHLVYDIDVCISVSKTAKEKDFVYAHALPADKHTIAVKDCRHPAIENAKGNDLTLNAEKNMLFLTGANMAGKSTFMKSFGIAVYLAHMGFPVAAKEMEFSVKDGLFSSINVADDLNQGYSHFYAEVLRVKQVAIEVSKRKNLVVIFDELFKGTNVKDAYDATLSVASSYSAYRNCAFIISTHIIEVGTALQEDHTNIRFAYLPTVMEGNIPRYTYQLTDGITTDRHGMMIIRNEKILEMMEED